MSESADQRVELVAPASDPSTGDADLDDMLEQMVEQELQNPVQPSTTTRQRAESTRKRPAKSVNQEPQHDASETDDASADSHSSDKDQSASVDFTPVLERIADLSDQIEALREDVNLLNDNIAGGDLAGGDPAGGNDVDNLPAVTDDSIGKENGPVRISLDGTLAESVPVNRHAVSPAPPMIVLPPIDAEELKQAVTEKLFAAVKDEVAARRQDHTPHLWAFLAGILPLVLGMALGAIIATGRFPAWDPKGRLAPAFWNAPVGILLFPVAGVGVLLYAREVKKEKPRKALNLLAGILIVGGLLLPFIGHFL